MGSSRSLLIFIFPILLNLIPPTTAQGNANCTHIPYYCWKCSDTATYMPGDMYQENLNNLLSSFTRDTEISSGFYNSYKGQDPNKVNAIALCRGDIPQDTCRTCLNDSINALLQNCSTHPKEAIMWAERCMVRYSNNLIIGIEEEDPYKVVCNQSPAKDSAVFDQVLYPLLSTLIEKAASGDSIKKFASGHARVPGGEIIYALVQCTPDINQLNCSNCLTEAVLEIHRCGGGMLGGRVLEPSCNLRYEVGLFFEATADFPVNIPPPGPAGPAPKEAAKKSNTKVIIIIVVVVVLVAFSLSSIRVYLRVKKRLRVKNRGVKLENQENSDENGFKESLKYDFDAIRSATDGFAVANKLGRGGFGTVYKGRLLDGQFIAAKKLNKNSEQGDREFSKEVKILAQLRHRNLVRLQGFCLTADERVLIYEFVAYSLDDFIFGPNNRKLDWETRYKIIGGIAQGIHYLHEESGVQIIHRDLKASNILLDEDMNPKIADFGIARMFTFDQTQRYTKAVAGTYEYMAPEYLNGGGKFSEKTDVFSFGVLILEIVSGQRIDHFRFGENEESLLSYAWRNWRKGTISNVIDPKLTTSSRIETTRCIHIGLLCVQENDVDRPTSASVVSMLNSHAVRLSMPSKPALHAQTTVD